jgi:hypothetical protein
MSPSYKPEDTAFSAGLGQFSNANNFLLDQLKK